MNIKKTILKTIISIGLISQTLFAFPTVTSPVIKESGDPDAVYEFSVQLDEVLPDGYYVAVNFDNQQGGWFAQSDAGGHIKLVSDANRTLYRLNRSLVKPGLRSFRAGIFDANDNLVGEYSDYTTCTLDRCLAEVVQSDNYGDPQLSGSGSQLVKGVDVVNGNLHYSNIDLSVPGKGPDFTLIRTYNSNADTWSFNLDMSIQYIEKTFNRQISVGPREDGRNQYFFKDMDKQWYALSPGNFDVLIEEDGGYTLYTQGNLYYKFSKPTESSSGKLLSIHDRDGNTLTFTYTGNYITGARDASNREYTITRDSNFRIIKVSDFTQRDVEYTYNSENMITSYKNPRDYNTTYTYNDTKLTSIIDPRKNTLLEFQYYTTDVNNNRIQYVIDDDGRYEYGYEDTYSSVKRPKTNDKNNNVAFTLDAGKTKIVERLDAQNYGDYKSKRKYRTTKKRQRIAEFSLVEQTTRPSGAVTNTSYVDDGTGNPAVIEDNIGRETKANWTSYAGQTNLTPLSSVKKPGITETTKYSDFTPSGKATKIVNPLNQTIHQTFNAGMLTQFTDARSNSTNIEYDAYGRPTKATDALGNFVQTSYDELGRISRQTNARGFSTTYTYDKMGNVLTIKDPQNHTTYYAYDESGNLTSIKDPKGNIVNYTYDTLNRQIAQSYKVAGVEYTTKVEYDAMGRVHKVVDENNNANLSEFDERGQVINRSNPLSEVTEYTYDKNGNIKTVRDPEGRTITYTYDSLDRVVRVTDSLGLYEEYAYGIRGYLIGKKDKKGRWTYYEYNDLGQMTKLTQPDGETTQAEYDANGNLTSTTDRKNQTAYYKYNAVNQMVEQTDALGRKWKFTYDANGNLSTRTLPSNKTIRYTYDSMDRVSKIEYYDGQIVEYTYDANGNRKTMKDAQGTTNYTYDELNRLIKVTNSFGSAIGYTFYPTGTLKELIYPDAKVVSYSYDKANRLKEITDWLGDKTSYTRDKSGFTTLITYGNGTTVKKTYDSAGRLKSLVNKNATEIISSHSITLDGIGNPTTISADIPLLPTNLGKSAEMLYDNSNRLTSIAGKSITNDSDGRLTLDNSGMNPIEYAYNAQDLITSISQNGTTTDQFTYDGEGKRISKTSDGETIRYVQDPTGGDVYSLLAETDATNKILHYYIYGEGLVSQVSGDKHRYYHYDQTGNTLALTDDTGEITDKYAYEPFGNTTQEGSSHNPFKFVGAFGVMDDGNGMHNMRARYYRADMRRFVSMDAHYGQVTDPLTLNRHQYVSGNPMVGIDPSGYALIGGIISSEEYNTAVNNVGDDIAAKWAKSEGAAWWGWVAINVTYSAARSLSDFGAKPAIDCNTNPGLTFECTDVVSTVVTLGAAKGITSSATKVASSTAKTTTTVVIKEAGASVKAQKNISQTYNLRNNQNAYLYIQSNQNVIKSSTQNIKNSIEYSNKVYEPYAIAGTTYKTIDFVYGEARGSYSIHENIENIMGTQSNPKVPLSGPGSLNY